MAINAIASKHQNITLIMGGIAKKENYAALFKLIDKKVSSVALIGQSAQDFAKNINLDTQFAPDMQTAIKLSKNTNPQAILLSPACASFDLFDDFEHRGRMFKDCVTVIV